MTQLEEMKFHRLMDRLASDPRCLRMKRYIQHGSVTTYEHAMRVSRMAYVVNLRMHAHADEAKLLRCAFLHDYFLYDWHEKGHDDHALYHPVKAAENARRDFGISEQEMSIIASHMWPLPPLRIPMCREAWILTAADKICSLEETLFRR